MSFSLGCDTMWGHEVPLKWPLTRNLSVNLVAEILMVNINYFYNSDDEKLVLTLHDKWGSIIYRLILKLIVIFKPKLLHNCNLITKQSKFQNLNRKRNLFNTLSLHGKQTHSMNDIFVSDSYKQITFFKLSVVITITLCTTNSGQDTANYSGFT
jgi:hypothetical protein